MKSITPLELKKIPNPLIIDVREKDEFEQNHIVSSYNIPFSVLKTNFVNYLNKNNTYYIICSQGMQSRDACFLLEQHGFKVINVLGGIKAWQGALI